MSADSKMETRYDIKNEKDDSKKTERKKGFKYSRIHWNLLIFSFVHLYVDKKCFGICKA